MKKLFIFLVVLAGWAVQSCQEANTQSGEAAAQAPAPAMSQEALVKRGELLVATMDCDICHTPKKMTEQGPGPDMSRRLMGHPADLKLPDIDKSEIAPGKWVLFNSDFTASVGPWGISYTANLTPHPSGIGEWSEAQFFKAIREGKHKGLDNGRPIMPPMPWQSISHLPDEDLRAIFTFLKSLPPIENVVPEHVPPGAI